MHISGKTSNIEISSCTFEHLGQSGIIVLGNDTAQPVSLVVRKNNIRDIGKITSAAGGIVCSSCSRSVFGYNNISWTSRWGELFAVV